MEVLLFTVLTLCALGVFSAVVLYFVARKFRVDEDPRIDQVEKMLPGANCGGCGFAGCRGMADALVRQNDISAFYCPVGGAACMKSVASYLGKAAPEKEAQVATVRCGGTCEKRPRTNEFDGAHSCAVASSLYVGETGCAFGCLGYGDCVAVCAFDAIRVNPATGLPEVDPDKCTACGACVKACPKKIIELRKKWPKNRAVYVSCVSRDKGAVVMKACKAGCIACGKCEKVCPFGAITIENNLAYIDPLKCKLCRKCVNECPTAAIRLVNMEPLPKEPKPAPGAKSAAAKITDNAPSAPSASASSAAAKTGAESAVPSASKESASSGSSAAGKDTTSSAESNAAKEASVAVGNARSAKTDPVAHAGTRDLAADVPEPPEHAEASLPMERKTVAEAPEQSAEAGHKFE